MIRYHTVLAAIAKESHTGVIIIAKNPRIRASEVVRKRTIEIKIGSQNVFC